MSDISLRSRFRLGGTSARRLVLAVRIAAGSAIALFALTTPGEMQLRVQGPQDPARSPDVIVKWMGEVRSALDRIQWEPVRP